MSSYGIIYAANSKAVRRIVVSDDPNYDYSLHVGPGEAHIVADKKQGSDVFAARAAVEAATGEKSLEPLCAVIDKSGVVVKMMMADPELDAIEAHELIRAYADVAEGHTYDKASDTFIAPIVTIKVSDELGKPEKDVQVGGPVPKPSVVK